MGAYSFLTNICDAAGKTPLHMAEAFGYPEPTQLVLAGKLEVLREKYPEEYRALVSCRGQRDNRSVEQYGQDLAASWIFEDCIFNRLNHTGYEVRRNGADAGREFLDAGRVRYESDFVIEDGRGERRKLELVCSYTGYWEETGRLHLRMDKYNQLVNERVMLLGIDAKAKRFFLIDFGSVFQPSAIYVPHHTPWDKPAYEITLRGGYGIISGKDDSAGLRRGLSYAFANSRTEKAHLSMGNRRGRLS